MFGIPITHSKDNSRRGKWEKLLFLKKTSEDNQWLLCLLPFTVSEYFHL